MQKGKLRIFKITNCQTPVDRLGNKYKRLTWPQK